MLVVLAAASCGAIFLIYRIEQAGSPVGRPAITPYFSPNGDGWRDSAVIQLRTPTRRHVDVWIENTKGDRVATIARNRSIRGAARIQWDGRTSAGSPAADGHYYATIRVRELRRTFPLRQPTLLDTRAPGVSSITLTPRQDGRAELVRVQARITGDVLGRRIQFNNTRVPLRSSRRETRAGITRVTLVVRMPRSITFDQLWHDGSLVVVDRAGNSRTVPLAGARIERR